jgi:hypothetical protein
MGRRPGAARFEDPGAVQPAPLSPATNELVGTSQLIDDVLNAQDVAGDG